MTLTARHLRFAYGALRVLDGVDLDLAPGVTAIVGPNAAGKTTLLRCLCGLLRPEGEVRLNGRDVRRLRHDELARAVSYLPQNAPPSAALTVFETVLLGRVHELRWHVARQDVARVQALLGDFGLAALGGRYLGELSGGQLQRVFLAQALARQPAVLLLDEPNTSLDFHHQFELCERIRGLTVARGLTTVMSVHDLNMAARVADTVYVLERGRIRCSGTPSAVLTEAMLADVYGIAARIIVDDGGRPLVTPIGLKAPSGGEVTHAAQA